MNSGDVKVTFPILAGDDDLLVGPGPDEGVSIEGWEWDEDVQVWRKAVPANEEVPPNVREAAERLSKRTGERVLPSTRSVPADEERDESCTRCGATPETGQTPGCSECEGVTGPLVPVNEETAE